MIQGGLDPVAIAVDKQGNVYLSDNNENIIKFDSVGNKVSYRSERLLTPGGVAVDDTGFVYYTDNGLSANRGMIWKSRINSENDRETTKILPRFPRPSGIAIDNAGSFYVGNSDSPKHLLKFTGDKTQLIADRGVTTSGIAVDKSGNVYFTTGTDQFVWKAKPDSSAPNGYAVDAIIR